jgi:hypothetical protein
MRIVIYEGDWYEYQEKFDESLLKLVRKELGRSSCDGDGSIKVDIEDPVEDYDARVEGLILPASKQALYLSGLQQEHTWSVLLIIT